MQFLPCSKNDLDEISKDNTSGGTMPNKHTVFRANILRSTTDIFRRASNNTVQLVVHSTPSIVPVEGGTVWEGGGGAGERRCAVMVEDGTV